MATNQSQTDPDALSNLVERINSNLVERIKENYQETPPPRLGKKRDFMALSFLLMTAVAVTLRTFGNIELRKLPAGDLKVTDVPLGDETFCGGLFPSLYEAAGGGGLSPMQSPQERCSWKDDLYDYRKEIIELLFYFQGETMRLT